MEGDVGELSEGWERFLSGRGCGFQGRAPLSEFTELVTNRTAAENLTEPDSGHWRVLL